MPALPLKVLNLYQLLGPAERFLLLLHLKVAHVAEQSVISHILILLLVGWGGLVALLPLRGGDLGHEPLQREVILGPGHLSGVGPGLHRGGDGLEAPSAVAALGPLSDQAGPGAEMHREEAGPDQQDEAGHTLDPLPLGADLVLEHQPEGAGLGLEPLLGADLGPDHQYEGGLVVDHQPGEVAGHAPEPQPGVGGHAPEPQLEEVVGLALEHQPGEGDLGLGHQQEEGRTVEV